MTEPVDPGNAGRTAVRGGAVSLAGQAAKFVLQTASLISLARVLDPTQFGLVAMVVALVGVATVLGDVGLSFATIQAKSITQQQRSNLFWINVAVGVGTGSIVYLLADPIAAYYKQDDLVPIVQALSLLFVLNGLTSQFKADLTRGLRFGKLAVLDVSAQAAAFLMALLLALGGAGYWALVAQQLVLAGVTTVLAVAFSSFVPSRPTSRAGIRPLLSFGSSTMLIQLLTYLSTNIDNVLVGRIWGPSALGIYSRAFQLFTLPMTQLATPLTRVAVPMLSRIEDREVYAAYLARAQVMIAYCLVGVFSLAGALADPLVRVTLGPAWDGVVPIFRVLVIGGVFQALGYLYYWVFLSKGLSGTQLRYSLYGRVLMIASIVVGVQFGPLGAAVGSAGGLVLGWVINSCWGVRKAGVDPGPLLRLSFPPLLLHVGSAATCWGVVELLSARSPWLQLVAGSVAAVAYLATMTGLFRRVRSDLRLVYRTLRMGLPTQDRRPRTAQDGTRTSIGA